MSRGRIWFVRAGKNAIHADDFTSDGWVGIGWQEVGPLTDAVDDEELDRLFEERMPDEREGSRRVWAAQIKRYMREVEIGDPVMTYDSNTRLYFIGAVKSAVSWTDGPLPRRREVAWTHKVPRDQLTVSTRNALGSIATFFRVNTEASEEIWTRAVPMDAEPEKPPVEVEPEPDRILRDEVVEKADAFIEDVLAKLSWQDMQELVAGVLRAMGYRTRVADAGADRGVDIFASPDGLGLEEPRIFVEVKHRTGSTMGADELRAFLGGRRSGDRCLYVSTGGFTKDAKYEADRANVPITLINMSSLRELLLQYYESLDAQTRAMVPLQRIYWPVE